MKHCNHDISGYWVIGAGWKGPETNPQSSSCSKDSWKLLNQLAKFGGLMSCGSKDKFKNAPFLMY